MFFFSCFLYNYTNLNVAIRVHPPNQPRCVQHPRHYGYHVTTQLPMTPQHHPPTRDDEQHKKGPNDAFNVVWAIHKSFSFFFLCLFLTVYFLLTNIMLPIECEIRETKVETTKTGPNDAKHVVWAIGKFFFLTFMFYYY